MAISRKKQEFCIAGIEVGTGKWIRPVSARNGGGLSKRDISYENRTAPNLLEIIRIDFIKPQPLEFQPENHLIDDRFYWVNTGNLDITDIQASLETKTAIFTNDSTRNGFNDKISEPLAPRGEKSLRLIKVEALNICVELDTYDGKTRKRVRGQFTFQGRSHKLSMTDLLVEQEYLAKAAGIYRVGPSILCISISQPYIGAVYALIAGLIK